MTALVLVVALVSTSTSTSFTTTSTTTEAVETTTSTTQPGPPLSHAYCVSDALQSWAHDHPGQDMTPADWLSIYHGCGP